MSRSAALPFILERGDDVMTDVAWSSTSETVHGLLRLEGDRLVVQWRVTAMRHPVGQGCDGFSEEVSFP